MGRKNIQQERRQQILNALYKCLLKKTYRDTTIKDIALEAGINHGMLHYYFRNKEEILLSFVDYTLEKYKADFFKWRDRQDFTGEDPKAIMRRFFSYTNEQVTLNKNLSKVFIVIWELSLTNGEVKKRLKKLYTEWVEAALETMGRSKEDALHSTMLSAVAYLEGMAMFSVVLNLTKKETRNHLETFQEAMVSSLF